MNPQEQDRYQNPSLYREFIIKSILMAEERVRREFTEGKRCLTCGELKGEGGELSDTCLKCLED